MDACERSMTTSWKGCERSLDRSDGPRNLTTEDGADPYQDSGCRSSESRISLPGSGSSSYRVRLSLSIGSNFHQTETS